jgi:CubicO group peptidase (beta-lactamase class C family)
MIRDQALLAHLREGVERGVFAGAAARVEQDGAVLFESEAGFARLEPEGEGALADPETLWDLASLTKPLAGTPLVLGLVESRLFSLEDGIARFDDLFRKTKFDGVTLRRLLAHTAGIVDWYPLYVRGEGRASYRKTLADLDPAGPPGRTVTYSCPGFLFLSEIVERVSGLPVDVLFREQVTAPLGLEKDLLFSPEGESLRRAAGGERADATERQKALALGLSYAGFRNDVVNGEPNDGNARRRGGVSLNAGLFGTARAVAAVAAAFLDRNCRLLKEASAAEAIRCQTGGLNEDRGLGWALARTVRSAGDALAPESFGHTGFTGSSVFVDPRTRRIFVLLAARLHPDARSAEEMIGFRRRFHELAAAIP